MLSVEKISLCLGMKYRGCPLRLLLPACLATAATAIATTSRAPEPDGLIVRNDGTRVLRDMTCATVDGVGLQLDLHLPPARADGGEDVAKLPLVMWIHGGGFYEGTRAFSPFSPLTLIPISQSEALRDALRAKSVEASLVVMPGAGHGIGSFDRAKLLRESREFLDRHLKKTGKGTAKP